MEAENNGRLVYTVRETAHLLGLSENTTRSLIAEGRLPHLRLGHRIVIPKARLHEMLAGASSEPTAQERGEGE